MSLPAPKIDKRNYDDIVQQTVKLAQHFTAHNTDSELLEAIPEELYNRTLAEDVKNSEGKIIAENGCLITKKVADAICLFKNSPKNGEKVKVKKKGWWQGERDAGIALIRIFGQMAELVSNRLNQTLEKNFLAYLNLIGVQLLPPQPAKVPLTFNLVVNSPEDALVPVYTPVAAKLLEGEEKKEVIFETDRELVVTKGQLQAVFVRQPKTDKDTDKYSECTSDAKEGKTEKGFEVFVGKEPIEHHLYLACDNLLALPGNKTLTLTLKLPNNAENQKTILEKITWSCRNGNLWESLSIENHKYNKQEYSVDFKEIKGCATPALFNINNKEARWLRASLNHPYDITITEIPNVKVNVKSIFIKPDLCFFNTSKIDSSKDFYPFGEQPRFNDTLYIASKEAFAVEGAVITLNVTLTPDLNLRKDASVEVAWEAWNGTDWQKCKISEKKQIASNFTCTDKGANFTITLPKIASTTVNGETNNWIRARIISGDYSTQATINQHNILNIHTSLTAEAKKDATQLSLKNVRGFMPGDTIQIVWDSSTQQSDIKITEITEIQSDQSGKIILATGLNNTYLAGAIVVLLPANSTNFTNSTYQAPSIQSLTFSYSYEKTSSVSDCFSYNDFTYSTESKNFQPFTATKDKEPTLYLGFDKISVNRPNSLYFQVKALLPEEIVFDNSKLQILDPNESVQLIWEYFSSDNGWKRLGVEDETNNFAQRGIIRFIPSANITQRWEFGKLFYWLRVRHVKNTFRFSPRLGRIVTNTVWASQSVTVKNEVLGSSNGNPNQSFSTTQTPVLQALRLEVQENLSLQEQEGIESLYGKDALTIIRDKTGQIKQIWVQWQEVQDFYDTGKRDRHYILNHLTGKVQFGDGQYGMIPPLGRNNIRMAVYLTGGGKAANKPALTISQLKTTVPFVESVTNLEAAGSGADQESIERVKERGPKILRHRDRAVTVQDFEDLVYEASTDIARVKILTPNFNPLDEKLWLEEINEENLKAHNDCKAKNAGKVIVLIVPNSNDKKPTPSLALIECVENYLLARAADNLKIEIAAPQWQEISVTAEIVPASIDAADKVMTDAQTRISEFLHPLTGSKNSQGWEFGYTPRKSDIYALLQSIPGVDYVSSIDIKTNDSKQKSDFSNQDQELDTFLIYSGTHTITPFQKEFK
ncbi:MAG: putative baseplate assembly protein [Scytonematopsis contorta HA4267-MV1]|jgi:hypothetical protein|nr:putative baseplate assembly protein [Scytonematopsis contorta HA4267-MV1]